MNTRELILTTVENDLANFRVQYGYELDYPNIEKGIITPFDNMKYPTVCFDLEDDNTEQSGSANRQQTGQTQLKFVIYIEDEKEAGKIVNIREQAISDIKKFVMQNNSITGFGTREHKVLRLGQPYTQAMGWNIQTSHQTNYKEAWSVITAIVNITYREFATTTPNYQT